MVSECKHLQIRVSNFLVKKRKWWRDAKESGSGLQFYSFSISYLTTWFMLISLSLINFVSADSTSEEQSLDTRGNELVLYLFLDFPSFSHLFGCRENGRRKKISEFMRWLFVWVGQSRTSTQTRRWYKWREWTRRRRWIGTVERDWGTSIRPRSRRMGPTIAAFGARLPGLMATVVLFVPSSSQIFLLNPW